MGDGPDFSPMNSGEPTAFKVLWKGKFEGSVIDVATTPNFSRIVGGSVDRTVRTFSFEGSELWCQRLDYEVWAVAISSDSSRIAAGTANKSPARGTLHVFDHAGNRLWQYELEAPVWGVTMASDGTRIALACWDGSLYLFEEELKSYKLVRKREMSAAGLYGVSMSHDAQRILVSAYEHSIELLDANLDVVSAYQFPSGTYRARITPDGNHGIVGTRDGGSVTLKVDRDGHAHFASRAVLSERPLCGVTIVPGALITCAGSFDGRIFLCDSEGECMWSTSTSGEVWSVEISDDGSYICAASGDSTLTLLLNYTSVAAIREIGSLEHRVDHTSDWAEQSSLLQYLVNLYTRYGLIEYGLGKLNKFRVGIGETLCRDSCQQLLEASLIDNPHDSYSHFFLGKHFEESRDWLNAAFHYIQGSASESSHSQALLKASDCFKRADLDYASLACIRRAREQDISNDEKRVLYNLARSYEDGGNLDEARKHLEVLLTWDPNYRDVFYRLRSLESGTSTENLVRSRAELDYTGLTVSLLGPDVPREKEVDETLHGILEARSKELHVSSWERSKLVNSLDWYCNSPVFEKYHKSEELDYDISAYLKYDNLLPEDNLKKALELINLLSLVSTPKRESAIALDIGSASGRNPFTLRQLGYRTVGLDHEKNAISYAKTKSPAAESDPYPQFVCGDGSQLPFRDSSLDLITCMMGTFGHLSNDRQENLLAEAQRSLREGGTIVISTWDPNCRHLSYLSMYSMQQKEVLRQNLVYKEHLIRALGSNGFRSVRVVPFCILPDVFSYELGFQQLEEQQLRRMLEVDLAARATFPSMSGQMFMAYGAKQANSY